MSDTAGTRNPELAVCEGCGRAARTGDALTAGGDTWWAVVPPWGVAYEESHACSIACARKAVDKLEPRYLELEDRLLGDPRHFEEGS